MDELQVRDDSVKLDITHEKAYLGFTFAPSQAGDPNNHRWFIHFYTKDRIHSLVHFDAAHIRTGNIKLGTVTWTEQTQFGSASHGRLALPEDALLVMDKAYTSHVYIGSSDDIMNIDQIDWKVNQSRNFGLINWRRDKNDWHLELHHNEEETVLDAASLVMQKPRTFETVVTEGAMPKVYLAFNFDTMAEIESVGSSIVL